jgi:hypothetical protein
VTGALILLGDLERDLDLLDRIVGTIHVGQWPARNAAENPVLAYFLPRPVHAQVPDRTRRTASFQPASRRSRWGAFIRGSNNASRLHKSLMAAGELTTPAWKPAR